MKITTPFTKEMANALKAGDRVLISGEIYTARDAAHKRMIDTIEAGGKLPFNLADAIIYYAGPAPSPPGKVIGSCGPTTSGRMDAYAPKLIKMGLRGMIGKGARGREVIDAMKEEGAVYFGAIGGAGALLSKCVVKAEEIAYADLGTESIKRLIVEDFPVIVLIDTLGNIIYK